MMYDYTITNDDKLLIELTPTISTEFYSLRYCTIFKELLKKKRFRKIDLPPYPMRAELFKCERLKFETK